MAASISISVVAWLILLAFAPIGQMLICKHTTSSVVHQFENDSCVLVQAAKGDLMNVAKCRSFDEYPNQWYLPALKTVAKHERLEQILGGLGWQSMWFWLGVHRYDNDTRPEKWGDLTKWFWTIDNSTVSDTLNIDPWAARTTGNSCVFVFNRLNATKGNMQWFNIPCGKPIDLSEYGTPLLVCESKDISTTTSTTSASSTTTMATSEATTRPTTGTTVATTSAMTTLEIRTTTAIEANSTRGNATTAVPDDPKSSTEKSSSGLSVSAWVAIALMVMLVLLVSGLVGFCLGKRYQKSRLAKRRIRRCDSDSSSESTKRSKMASYNRSTSAQSSSLSEEFHDHGQSQGTTPKGKQKEAAVEKVLPKGKSQKKVDSKSK